MAFGKMAISFIAILLNYLFYFTCGEMYSDIGNYADKYRLHYLPYLSDALEEYMDEETVNIHYKKHHAAYTAKLNAALEKWRESKTVLQSKCTRPSIGKQSGECSDPKNDPPKADHMTGNSDHMTSSLYQEDCKLCKKPLLYLLKHLDEIPQPYQTAIRNNGGGYVNHNFFWEVLSAKRDTRPSKKLMKDINAKFESYQQFVDQFTETASSVFGSGYAWLSRDSSNNLVITTTANQDCPISKGLFPILVIDVWEHAYYLKHRNRRPEFIGDWWKLVDWKKVEDLDTWWKNSIV